jgi:hypothetical protein
MTVFKQTATVLLLHRGRLFIAHPPQFFTCNRLEYFVRHHTYSIADKHHYIFHESIALEILKLKNCVQRFVRMVMKYENVA